MPCIANVSYRILYYKIAQFVGNAVGVYTSGHTGAACAARPSVRQHANGAA